MESEELASSPSPEPQQKPNLLFLAVLLVFAGLFLAGLWLFLRPAPESPAADYNAFNLEEAPKAEAAHPAVQLPAPASEAPSLKAFIPEKDFFFTSGAASERKREQDFIRKYDAQMRGYMDRVLDPLGQRYRKKYAVVKEMDLEFGRLDRYMELNRKYQKDRDLHQWARGVIALPEVRSTLMKYAMKPEIWQVAFQMGTEAMKTPPPKPVQDEVMRMLTTDKQLSKFIGDAAAELAPNIVRLTAQAAPPGADIGPLTALAAQLVTGKTTSPAPMPVGAGRRR
ncbi:MAG: hypothetical protein WCU88_12205 [Elusimicrobiota bacterium]|jgi:hypothetical protein